MTDTDKLREALTLVLLNLHTNNECACMGPQFGEPLCPCAMTHAVRERLLQMRAALAAAPQPAPEQEMRKATEDAVVSVPKSLLLEVLEEAVMDSHATEHEFGGDAEPHRDRIASLQRLAAAPQPDVIGRADNMPLADMARAEAFRSLARCIHDPSQPRKMGLSDLAGVLAWEERRISALATAPQPAPDEFENCTGYPVEDGLGENDPAPVDREALVKVLRPYVGAGMGYALADALLARGLRLPGPETMAWALVGDDEAVLADTVRWERGDVDAMFSDLGPSVRVAIRVVEGGDDE